jgi:hypothetical protein
LKRIKEEKKTKKEKKPLVSFSLSLTSQIFFSLFFSFSWKRNKRRRIRLVFYFKKNKKETDFIL